MLLLKNGKVILEKEIVKKDILIDGENIVRIEDNIDCEIENLKDVEIMDCNEMFISPGFIDIHTHGGGGHDYMEGTKEAFIKATSLHFSHGTTSIVPTTVASTYDLTIKFLDDYKRLKDLKDIKPRLLGVHLEGPYLALNQKGAIPGKNIKDPDKNEYLSILNHSNDILRWTIAPERKNAFELGDELKSRGISASMGHSDATAEDVYEACKHGFNCVTHLYSMTSTIVRKNCYRYPGINETAYLCDELYTEAICDGHHLPDTLIKLIYKNKGSDRMVLITDSMAAAGLGEGRFYLGNPEDDQQVVVKNGVAFMPDMSSFAGSVATSDVLLKTLYKVGISLTEIIKMMTITPARLLKLEKEIGSIEVNKKADIVIFDKELNVKQVFRGENNRFNKE